MLFHSLQQLQFDPEIPSERYRCVRPLRFDANLLSPGDALPPGISSRTLRLEYENKRSIEVVPVMNPAPEEVVPPLPKPKPARSKAV